MYCVLTLSTVVCLWLQTCSGFDGCGRLWDLRSGKCVLLLDGHLKGVLTITFSPIRYGFISCSAVCLLATIYGVVVIVVV